MDQDCDYGGGRGDGFGARGAVVRQRRFFPANAGEPVVERAGTESDVRAAELLLVVGERGRRYAVDRGRSGVQCDAVPAGAIAEDWRGCGSAPVSSRGERKEVCRGVAGDPFDLNPERRVELRDAGTWRGGQPATTGGPPPT